MTNFGSKTPSGNPRIYNCKQCERAFTREEHLTRHTLSTHNKLKPFSCGICQRPFSRRDLLLRHAKNLHQGSEAAVSRIRKSYRREKGDDLASDSGSDSESPVPSAPPSSSSSPLSPLMLAVQVAAATPKVTLPSPQQLAIPFPEDPEKKRLKMSVNMLVS